MPTRTRNGVAWTEELTSRLIELRRDGIANVEICELLGVSSAQLEAKVSRLIREGRLDTRKGLLASHPDAYVDGCERTAADVAADVARLYSQGRSHQQIGEQLKLTRHQVHNILTQLFLDGLQKRPQRQLSEQQVRAIYSAYKAGGSIDTLADELGFTGSAVRERMRKLGLPTLRAKA